MSKLPMMTANHCVTLKCETWNNWLNPGTTIVTINSKKATGIAQLKVLFLKAPTVKIDW